VDVKFCGESGLLNEVLLFLDRFVSELEKKKLQTNED
jgi:hypothetical protein